MNTPGAAWKRWIVIGSSAAITLAACAALIFLGFAWYSSRPVPWNTRTVTTFRGDATETYELQPKQGAKPGELLVRGFQLTFALQNNTARDVTIPEDATVMEHLVDGGTLADSPAKLSRSYFIPAHQRVQILIQLDYSCSEEDIATGARHERDPHVCFGEALRDADGLVLLDRINRIQVTLPKPALR
jgi:hypothetical protein